MKLSKTKCGFFASLSTAKMRQRYRLFIAEGRKAVNDLMKSFAVEAVIISESQNVSVPDTEAPVYFASDADLRRISNLTTPPDIVGVFRMPDQTENLRIESSRIYLMLDGVRDPGNLGTIIRTCHWFGIFRILASRDCADCYNPKVVQATMGSLGRVQVHYCDLDKICAEHPEMPVYGLLLDGEDIFRADLEGNGFIVMGNEGSGISSEMRERVTSRLLIPPATSDHGESLNVAVATAITLAQFRK